MLTDDEITILARRLLAKVLQNLSGLVSPDLFQPYQLENGELMATYSGTSEDGYGSFSCEYFPDSAAQKIVAHCDQLYEEFLTTSVDADNKQAFEDARPMAVEGMADCAILHLMASFGSRIRDTVEDAVEDSYIIGAGLAMASIAKYISNKSGEQFTADARPKIEEAVRRAAEKRRALVRQHLKAIPNLLAERGRGAPIKSPPRRERERKAYTLRIKEAYRELRLETAKKPSKTSVAKKLGEGGLNPKTGGESYLQAFRLKLIRLEIDYDATVQQTEDEVNNKSK